MAETNTEDGHLTAQLSDRLGRNARILRRSRPRRNDNAVVTRELGDGHLVIAMDHRLDTELAQVLHEVVGERVVVVHDGELRCWSAHCISSAISIALNIAPA